MSAYGIRILQGLGHVVSGTARSYAMRSTPKPKGGKRGRQARGEGCTPCAAAARLYAAKAYASQFKR